MSRGYFFVLNHFSEANPTAIIRVQFDAIITLKLNLAASNFLNQVEKINIVRGTDPNINIIFDGISTLISNGSELGGQEYSFSASDYNVPKGSGFLIYTAFVRNITGTSEADVTRVGPESFNVLAIG
ncbi:hypothetical protein H7F28_13880 [Brevibacterium sp. PAMC23299]|nr:hypothetical protein H7F28_13880 [Brevibacterium sp. PAMC23299]